jgi:Taurine catabolism dioxygenase TauD, TfdA family
MPDTFAASTTFDVAPSPIGGPLAWRSVGLERDRSWIHRLTGAEVWEIERAVDGVRDMPILEIRKADFPLPLLAAKIATLRHDVLARLGFAYLRGLPVERYDRQALMRLYWGLSCHIGDAVPQNRNGHMIGHVIDIGTSVDDVNKRITQTNASLQFHSDSCDVVGLLCLKTAMEGGESALVSAIAVHDEMMRRAPDLCRALYQPLTCDRRGEIPDGKQPWMRIPLFMWRDGTFTGYAPLKNYVESARRFDEAPQNTALQEAAFTMFLDICNDPTFRLHVPFESGDFQFVQNHVVFHARTAFADWPEVDRKRHLMRIWLSVPDGRELHPAIAERWVNIERGTVRGGVNIPERKALTVPLEPLTPAFA